MGSINLTNLLMNMHVNSISSKNITTSTKDTSNTGGFNEALNKASNSSKTANKKPSTSVQEKMTPKKVNKSSQIESIDLEEVVGEEVAEAIVSILSVQLQIPVEEVTAVLEEIGLTPVDLLQEDNFSQFITAFYGESSTEELLIEDTQIKDVSKLFTKIQEVSTQIVGDEIHKVIEQTTTDSEVLKTQTTVTEEIPLPKTEEVSILEETISNVVVPKDEKVVEVKEPVTTTYQMPQSHLVEHLGLTVPIQAFEKTISLTNDQVSQNMSGVHVRPELNIASQIVDHIEITKLEQMQEIKMQLSPKELGEVTIKMVEKNGVLVAEIKVENEKTKDFILNEIGTLKDSLTKQGIDISHIQVDIRQNDSKTQMEQQKQKSSKRIQEIIAKHLQEIEDEEAQIQEITPLDVGESEIDYMI